MPSFPPVVAIWKLPSTKKNFSFPLNKGVEVKREEVRKTWGNEASQVFPLA